MVEDAEDQVSRDVFNAEVDLYEDVGYPTVDEMLEIHDLIVEDGPRAEPGVRSLGQLKHAVDHIRFGSFGEVPESLHEKAFQLMRLVAANHPFVDGDKRTLESGDITLQDIRENEEVRKKFSRLLILRDMEEHRDIYDRLAEV